MFSPFSPHCGWRTLTQMFIGGVPRLHHQALGGHDLSQPLLVLIQPRCCHNGDHLLQNTKWNSIYLYISSRIVEQNKIVYIYINSTFIIVCHLPRNNGVNSDNRITNYKSLQTKVDNSWCLTIKTDNSYLSLLSVNQSLLNLPLHHLPCPEERRLLADHCVVCHLCQHPVLRDEGPRGEPLLLDYVGQRYLTRLC